MLLVAIIGVFSAFVIKVIALAFAGIILMAVVITNTTINLIIRGVAALAAGALAGALAAALALAAAASAAAAASL